MKQPNEVSAEKVANLEAQLQQKNKERMEAREKMTKLQDEKQKFDAKFRSQMQQLEAKYQAEKQQLVAKFQPEKQRLEARNDMLKSENNVLEMDAAKLRAELKAIKIQGRADHCSRHPRMLAGLRVGCGGQGHLLCIGCIRSWSSNPANLGHCPLCKKPIKSGQLGVRELKQIVDKLMADEKMMRPDTSLPLPFELSAEIWEFARKKNVNFKAQKSFVLYRPNRLEGPGTGNLTFPDDDGLSVSKEDTISSFSTVRAVKPFCLLKSALIDYCVPDCFYFEMLLKEIGFIFIGLSGPDFPLANNNTYVGTEPGSYSLDSSAKYRAGPDVRQQLEKELYVIHDGDVVGCGLLVSPNDHRHRIFFTMNGRPFGKSILLPAMANNQQLLFPTITLSIGTSIVANFGDDPERPFRYRIRKVITNQLERKAPKNDVEMEEDNHPTKKRARPTGIRQPVKRRIPPADDDEKEGTGGGGEASTTSGVKRKKLSVAYQNKKTNDDEEEESKSVRKSERIKQKKQSLLKK